jgi:hypothetical protein
VDLSDDLPSPRRPLFFPVVIATVFLTIIAMSAGIALAAWNKAQNHDNHPQSISTPTTEYSSPAVPTGPLCRDETQQMGAKAGAQGALRIQLQLRTKTSAVWICEDEAGRFYYHANRGGDVWIENKTALFLSGVQPDGEGGFTATATDGTRFSITKARLQILHKDGRLETQWAVG